MSSTWFTRLLLALCLACTLTALAAPALVIPGKSLVLTASTAYPSVALRGYGTLSGSAWTGHASASVLLIHCESVDKAQITHAKYLSDLGLLPGVTVKTVNTALGLLPVRMIDGQGCIAAVRAGTEVLILTGASEREIVTLCAENIAKPATIALAPEVEVPMFLDRWDRFGFRFYYRPWGAPEGKTLETYNPITAEFDYAKNLERAGFVFWASLNTVDTAEGQLNDSWYSWGATAAKQRNLPVGMNLSASGQTWLLNRYREQTTQKMPQYCGGNYKVADSGQMGGGAISWNATTAKDQQLAELQQYLRAHVNDANITSWLEPHGELVHGLQDIFLEYGPVADKTFRTYLQQQYGTLAAVSTRFTGSPKTYKSWNDVRVPELASFLGWGPKALDLTGEWRVQFLPEGTPTAPTNFDANWFKPDFDDRTWSSLLAPGNDQMMFTPKRPAVYRRTFTVDPAWKAARKRVWLYVWDLNTVYKDRVQVYLNGTQVGNSLIIHPRPHWDAYEVTDTLRAGENHLALGLPSGVIGYRAYLSADAPLQYPNMSAQQNALWVDFANWIVWSRIETARRGIEMIRQVDPNRGITMMHPDEYSNGIKELCQDYGAQFHNTGYMSSFWSDYLPMLMAGADLPFSIEPSAPARTLNIFKKHLGNWATEGVQAIDYFIHVGSILWNEPMRQHFEEEQPVIRLFGKYHFPKAETAVLYSTECAQLTNYPWNDDPNTNLRAGYWRWNLAAFLREAYPRDGLSPSDFARGNAAKYRVIFDSNTTIMDEKMVQQIEKYVRDGGTFVTYAQTGRHTPTERDSWPISRLTGYKVTHIDQYGENEKLLESGAITAVPGQRIFPAEEWQAIPANGLHLQKIAPECQDLLRWQDGSVAVGLRPLGKGFIINIGAKFSERGLPDRLSAGENRPETQQLTNLLTRLLEWRNVAKTPAYLSLQDYSIIMRRFVSNNGMYDVWVLWNSTETAQTTDILFRPGYMPERFIEVKGQTALPIVTDAAGARIAGLQLGPMDTRVFLVPRKQVAQAPGDWFTLQRNWWRGTRAPSPTPLPKPEMKLTVDLNDDWAFLPLEATTDVAPLVAPAYDDAKWERIRMGIWNVLNHADVRHALLRKRITVPATWTNGRVSFWLQSFFNTTFMDRGRVFLDGKLVRDYSPDGLAGEDFSGAFTPGSTHVIAVEIDGKGTLNGSRGNTWLSYVPAPLARIDLAGAWQSSRDALDYATTLQLPGRWDAFTARRTVQIDAKYQGKNVVLHVDTPGGILGVLTNGHWVRRNQDIRGDQFDLNITPWIEFGKVNTIELVNRGGPGKSQVNDVSLNIYDPAVYP